MEPIRTLEECIFNMHCSTTDLLDEVIVSLGYTRSQNPKIAEFKESETREWTINKDGKEEYKWIAYSRMKHEWGCGGNSIDRKSLKKNDLILFNSEYHTCWDTYSDDSQDSAGPSKKISELYTKDPLATELFNAVIKQYEKNKYLVHYKEVVPESKHQKCGMDTIYLIESKKEPNLQNLIDSKIISNKNCMQVTNPQCEECNGKSEIIKFEVEPFTIERAKELGLNSELYDSDKNLSSKNFKRIYSK